MRRAVARAADRRNSPVGLRPLANHFLKRSSLIALSRDGLAELAPDIRLLADKEGLSAHRSSVDLRLEKHSGKRE